jgi:rRNA maturation endonuclease Nob1
MRPEKDIAGWPGNSAATRTIRQKSWTVVLRCYACQRRFSVGKITLDRLALAPQATPCAHCGAQPDATTWMKVHHIMDLREDTNRTNSSDPSSSAV